MADRVLRAAFVEGARFAPLYDHLPEFTEAAGRLVDVAYREPLPALLDRLLGPAPASAADDPSARPTDSGASPVGSPDVAPLHLTSAHSRYTADLASHMLPLDDLLGPEFLTAFDPEALEWCRWEGRLVQVPRSVETRLLYYRTDILEDRREREWFCEASGGADLRVPATWDELAVVAQHFTRRGRTHGFTFPGADAGLVALFAEILVSVGGTFLDPDGTPRWATRAGEWVVTLLRDLFRRWEAVPPEMPRQTEEDVSHLFRMGLASLCCDYPDTARLLRDPTFSAVAGWHSVALYPTGPEGARAVWTGAPTFAIPAGCPDPDGAAELLRFLLSTENQLAEAKQGALPSRLDAREAARDALRLGTIGELRFRLAEQTLREAALVPPRFPGYRHTEERLRQALLRAVLGEQDPAAALTQAAAGE